ncbi:MAG TPA: VWA domain-containing protein [Myxococcaceae bacterium]|nr:VWA domain-containing protein [Myxococcaceae bacterium]
MRNASWLVALACLAATWPGLARAQEDEEDQPQPEERPAEQPKKKKRAPESSKPRGNELPGWAESWPETFRAAQQGGSLRITARMTPSALPPGPSDAFALVTIRAPIYPVERQAPLNVALVMDKSESMKGARLVATKRAAREVIGELDERDRLAIIAVSDDTETLPAREVTEGNRARMLAFVDRIQASGGSNLSGGIEAAISQVSPKSPDFEFNRVVVVTDGIATRGLTDKDSLANVAKKARTVYRIHVSAVGVGEDCDEDVLQRIVKDGWGFLTYVRGPSQAARVGHLQKLEVLRRAAEQTELRLKAGSGVQVVDVLNYQAMPSGDALVVPLDEAGPGDEFNVVMKLRVNVRAGMQGSFTLGTAELSYLDMFGNATRNAKVEISAPISAKGPGAPDPEVTVEAAKAVTAKNLVLAEEKYEEQNRSAALEILDQTEDALGQMMKAAPKDALSEELVAVASAMERYAPPAGKGGPPAKVEKKKKRGRGR